MPIVPDTKNWTWVLERPCEECGYDVSLWPATAVGAQVQVVARRLADALALPGATVRPDDATWSPLEYSAHVRDVALMAVFRIGLMQTGTEPSLPNWDQDETAVLQRYGEQHPAIVAAELVDAIDRLTSLLGAVADWDRGGRRTDGAWFTTESFARYVLHDFEHHVWDVTGTQSSR